METPPLGRCPQQHPPLLKALSLILTTLTTIVLLSKALALQLCAVDRPQRFVNGDINE